MRPRPSLIRFTLFTSVGMFTNWAGSHSPGVSGATTIIYFVTGLLYNHNSWITIPMARIVGKIFKDAAAIKKTKARPSAASWSSLS